jgi:hypothetical protein
VTPGLPVRDRTQTFIRRVTRLRRGLSGVPPFMIFQTGMPVQPPTRGPTPGGGETYNLFPGNCHPFQENMAPDLPPLSLNEIPPQSDFQAK